MTQEELNLVIQKGEGFKAEFKRYVNNDLAKEMVAFANASGGTIYIGIDDDGSIPGIIIDNELRSQVQGIARNCDPPVTITLKEHNNNILIIEIPEGREKPFRCTGGFYIRMGANSQKLTTDEIVAFIQYVGRVQFDNRGLPTAKISTYLDEGKLNHFLELSNIENKLPNEDLLINLDVAIKDSETYFNNAGILFFSDASKAFLPHSSIDCVLFKGTDKANISDRKEFDDDIISNIEDALLFCRTHLKVEYKIDGSRRTEVLEIPEVALREAIVNAVAHRDYLVTGARVSIEIFDDRVDISNPGGLPPGLSKNEFGKRSLTRNPILSSLLYRSKYIERLGTGISRIKDALKNVNLPEPIFHFDGFFTITIRRIDIYIRTIGDKYEVPISRAIRIKSILESLNSDTEFIVKDVAEALNVNDRTIRKDLEFLLDNGLISSSGSTKSTVYHIDERGKTLIK